MRPWDLEIKKLYYFYKKIQLLFPADFCKLRMRIIIIIFLHRYNAE